MGATYLSLQLRTADRAAAVAVLETVARENPAVGVRCYVGEPLDGWLAVYPNFTPEIERVGKDLSGALGCLVVLLLSADEDDLYCMFFRGGKQLPWFKIGVGRNRRGKEREKLAAKLEALADVCDAECRAKLVAALADAKDVTFSSDLLRAVCDATGIRSAFTSFEYLARGEREGLVPPAEPLLVPAPPPA
jgi:hypothetical protein